MVAEKGNNIQMNVYNFIHDVYMTDNYSVEPMVKLYQKYFDLLKDSDEQNYDEVELFGQTHLLISLLNPLANEELCEHVVFAIVQRLSKRRGLLNFVKDVNNKCLSDDFDKFISKGNIKNIMFDDGNLLFLYRVLIEYCMQTFKRNDAALSNCLYVLAPTLTEFANIIERFLECFSLTTEENFNEVSHSPRRRLTRTPSRSPNKSTIVSPHRMTRERKEMLNQQKSFGYVILQILRIFHTLDPEPVGLAKWREILLSLIQNQNTPLLQENVLPQIMESIYYVHFKQDGDFDLLLNDFCDVLNLTFPEIIGGNDDVPETPPSSPQRVLYNEAERRIRCLATFAAFLKTPHQFFKDPEIISPQILGLYDILVGGKVHVAEGDEPQAENRPQHGIYSDDPRERRIALECVGWKAYCAENALNGASMIIYWALGQQLNKMTDIETTIICLSIFSDLIIRYGYKKVSSAYALAANDEGEHDDTLNVLLIEHFFAFANCQNAELTFCAVEGLCRLLIYPDIFVDDQDGTLADSIRQRILTFVLPFGFRIDLNDTKVNACIAKVLPLFASISRANQLLLVNSFFDTIKSLKTPGIGPSNIDTVYLSKGIVSLTSEGLLHGNGNKDGELPHEKLARFILANSEDFYANIYFSMLASLDPVEDIKTANDLVHMTENLIAIIDEDADNALKSKKIVLLQQYCRRLKKIVDKDTRQTVENGNTENGRDRQTTPDFLAKAHPSAFKNAGTTKKNLPTVLSCTMGLMHISNDNDLPTNKPPVVGSRRRTLLSRKAKQSHMLYSKQLNFSNITDEEAAEMNDHDADAENSQDEEDELLEQEADDGLKQEPSESVDGDESISDDDDILYVSVASTSTTVKRRTPPRGKKQETATNTQKKPQSKRRSVIVKSSKIVKRSTKKILNSARRKSKSQRRSSVTTKPTTSTTVEAKTPKQTIQRRGNKRKSSSSNSEKREPRNSISSPPRTRRRQALEGQQLLIGSTSKSTNKTPLIKAKK